ncbi:hypothetical protein ACQKM2_01685 [Streptomyces sp. NPDC004126]
MYLLSWDGTSWHGHPNLPARSIQGPAIVAYCDPDGTKDQLFAVWRGPMY